MDQGTATAKTRPDGSAPHLHLVQASERRFHLRHLDELPNVSDDDFRALREMDIAQNDEGTEPTGPWSDQPFPQGVIDLLALGK